MSSTRRAKPRRKRGSLIVGRVGLAHDEAVITWMTDRMAEGMPRHEVVAASKAGEYGWPLADTDGGRGLNHGTYESVRAVVADRERNNTQSEAPHRRRTAGKRKAQIHAERRNGNDTDIIMAQLQMVKMTGILESMDLAELFLDDKGVTEDTLRRIFDDLADLQSWMEYSQYVISSRMDEISVRAKIASLRTKTVANGCTPHEEGSARRLADKLEGRLDNRLPNPVKPDTLD